MLLSCHHTYSTESTYHTKRKLFILTQHLLHSPILYLLQYTSLFSLSPSFFPPFLIFVLICGRGFLEWKVIKTAGSACNHIPLIFERSDHFFLCWTTHWDVSLTHQCTFKHIFPSRVHVHGTVTKITIGKQKRVARGNLIPASNYSRIQSSEECQEIAKPSVC